MITLKSVIVAFLFAISLWFLFSYHKGTCLTQSNPSVVCLTTGTCSSASGGTFDNATDGTFHSATAGTFVSATGGTFNPLLSVYMSSVSTEERKELVKKYDIPTKEIYLAGGCFWGVEKYFKLVRGVVGTETGYANGSKDNPSYEEVYTDSTGHAETVRVKYVPVVVSLNTLLELYFKAIDPFSLNKQGEDEGTRYRTGIYFTDEKDKAVVNRFIEAKTAELKARPVVEVRPLKCFFSAEEYHQDYLDKNPGGYCHLHPELFEYVKNL